jgi:hypothetical protein
MSNQQLISLTIDQYQYHYEKALDPQILEDNIDKIKELYSHYEEMIITFNEYLIQVYKVIKTPSL